MTDRSDCHQTLYAIRCRDGFADRDLRLMNSSDRSTLGATVSFLGRYQARVENLTLETGQDCGLTFLLVAF